MPKPASIIAQVAGSGTAPVGAEKVADIEGLTDSPCQLAAIRSPLMAVLDRPIVSFVTA